MMGSYSNLGATLGAGTPRARDRRGAGDRVVASPVETCPTGYETKRVERYRDGVLYYVNTCVPKPVCIDASTVFVVDDTPLVFSWNLLNAAGVEERFTSPETTIRAMFGGASTVTGNQLAREALRRWSRGRTGVSPVCISYGRRPAAPPPDTSAGSGSGWPSSAGSPPPLSLDTLSRLRGRGAPPPLDLPPTFDIVGGGSAADLPPHTTSDGGSADLPPHTTSDGGSADLPPHTTSDGGSAELPPDTAVDAPAPASGLMALWEQHRGVITVAALAVAAYAGYRVWKGSRKANGRRRRRNIVGPDWRTPRNRRRNGAPIKVYLSQVRLNQGGYTSKGRYFGTPHYDHFGGRGWLVKPLYEYSFFDPDYGDQGDYIRAASRDEAKALIRKQYPTLTFRFAR